MPTPDHPNSHPISQVLAVPLGTSPNLSSPQFPHLYNRDNSTVSHGVADSIKWVSAHRALRASSGPQEEPTHISHSVTTVYTLEGRAGGEGACLPAPPWDS